MQYFFKIQVHVKYRLEKFKKYEYPSSQKGFQEGRGDWTSKKFQILPYHPPPKVFFKGEEGGGGEKSFSTQIL